MRVLWLAVLAGVWLPLSLTAQTATVRTLEAPLGGSVNLAAIDDKYNAQVISLEMPKPDGKGEYRRLQGLKEAVSRQFPRKRMGHLLKTTTAPQPAIALHYVADTNSGIPPDNDLAVSVGNKSVSVINSSVAVHDATTGQLLQRKILKLFSNGAGLPTGLGVSRYDPKVIYDPYADRFICVILHERDADNWIIVGFSASNDPAGIWKFYKFYGDISTDLSWFDYPSIAITEHEFFLTGNKISFDSTWQSGFRQTVIYQIKKRNGYQGDATLPYQLWENIAFNGTNIRNLYPVKQGIITQGPEQYFLSNRNFDLTNDTVFLIKIPDTMGSTANNLTITALKSNLSYGLPPDGRQMDTFTLATNDARVLGAYRVADEIQFTSTSVHPQSGSSAVYHGRISNFATAPVLTANFFMIDTLDFGYPNLSFAGNHGGLNHSILSFNYTGPNDHPGLAAIYFDGTQYSDMLKIKTGDSTIMMLNGKQQRWGDYMGSQPDWNATGVVWVEGIYGRHDRTYGNYIAKLVSPFFTGLDEYTAASQGGHLYPNPAFRFTTLDFELREEADLSFVIYDLNGRRVDELLRHRCRAGKNKLQFNVASLASGIYVLKAMDPAGKERMTKRFVKQ